MAKKDGLNEGTLVINLKNDIIGGRPYELNNLIGNIKVAIEEAQEVADILDFTDVEIMTERGKDLQTVNFELRIRMTIIGDMFNSRDEDNEEDGDSRQGDDEPDDLQF